MARVAAHLGAAALALFVSSVGAGRGYAVPPEVNLSPTIGVLSVPIADAGSPCDVLGARAAAAPATAARTSCFTAFYARWVEAAGARAVLIPFDAAPDVLAALLDSVNGVLLTGGSLEAAGLAFDAPYMVAAAAVLAAAKRKNDAGLFFPIHGTCQGFQVLALLGARNASVLSYAAFDAENLALPLDISWDGHHSSRIFAADSAPAAAVDTLMLFNATLNMHHDGVAVADWVASAALGDAYILASTNVDRAGRAFASTLEAWDYPITGTQWHPERVLFEWRDNGADHSARSVAANYYIGTFFIADARRNWQNFTDAALFARFSSYTFPLVSAPDAATSGYQWIVTDF